MLWNGGGKMLKGDRWRIGKYGLLAVVLYWLIATIKSTILIADSSFWVNLYYPGAWDLILRLITVVGILVATYFIYRLTTSLSAEKNQLTEELTNLQYLFDAADCPIIELDQDHKIKSVNKAAALLTGIKPEDLLLQDAVSALFHTDAHEQVLALLDSPKAEDSAQTFRLKVRRLDKCYVTVKTSKEIVNGKVQRQLLFFHDVTQQLNELEAHSHNLATITEALKNCSIPLVLFTSNQILLTTNAFIQLLNMEPEQLTLANLQELVNKYTSTPDALTSALDALSQNQQPQHLELTCSSSNGTYSYIVHLTTTEANSPLLAWVEDITALRASQAETANLTAELEQLRQKESELHKELQQHAANYHLEKQQLLEQIAAANEQINQLNAQIAQSQDLIVNLKSEMENHITASQTIRDQLIKSESANQQLQRDYDQLKDEYTAIDLPIIKLTFDGLVTETNHAAKALLNVDTGTNLANYLSNQEQRLKLEQLIRQLQNGDASAACELEFSWNQKNIVLDCRALRLQQSQAQVLLYGYDITPFQQAQRELALTLDSSRFELEDVLNEIEIERERMNAILVGIKDGIVITDMYNRVLKMNPAAEDILGIRLSQALERPVHFIIRNHEIISHIQKTVREGLSNYTFTLEITPLHSQSPQHVICTTTLIKDRNFHDQGIIIHFQPADQPA